MGMIETVASLVREADQYTGTLSKDRIRAVEYYQGKMRDTPFDTGRSSMVTRDLRSQIKKVLPSLVRTILQGDEVVEYLPQSQEDEPGCEQSSDYMNYVVMQESGARQVIYDAIHDALLVRNGIIKWWWEDRKQASTSHHTGLPDMEFEQLVGDPGVELLEHTERQEDTEQGPVTLHDCKIKRVVSEGRVRVAAVPRERFLIHPDAVSLDDSLIVGEKTTMTRSDLIAMGYAKKMVMGLPVGDEADYEEAVRRDTRFTDGDEDGVNEEIDYYDLFVRVDADGDGIAELHHMCFAGGLMENNLLVDEECDDVQFCDIAIMRQPHQWEGISLSDDLMDLQRVKTVLLRQTLDNIYWQNNPQPVVDESAVENMDALMNPEFGLPIRIKSGRDVRAVLGFNTVPFVAQNSFAMLEYIDKEAQDRTGVSDASSGLAPDALQNMTAKASAMIEAAGIGQTELMVKTVADGLRRFFKGLLRLTIKHQDVARTVRLRNEWVNIDPRDWNANMDCTVNTGLGAGTRERDMMMMQQVMAVQEKLLSAFGPDNPYVKPDQVYNSASKMIEAAGLKTVSLYFTQPDKQEVQSKLDAMKNAPSPEQQKAQATMQLEQGKMQATMQMRQAEMQATMQLEQGKAQAAMQLEQMRAQIDDQRHQRDTMAKAAQDQHHADLQSQLQAHNQAVQAQQNQHQNGLESAREVQRAQLAAELAAQQRNHDAALEQSRLQFEQWKVEFTESTKIVVAQISAKTTMDQSLIAAVQSADMTVAEGDNDPMQPLIDMHGKTLEAINGVMQQLAKPKTITRGADGKATGIA